MSVWIPFPFDGVEVVRISHPKNVLSVSSASEVPVRAGFVVGEVVSVVGQDFLETRKVIAGR